MISTAKIFLPNDINLSLRTSYNVVIYSTALNLVYIFYYKPALNLERITDHDVEMNSFFCYLLSCLVGINICHGDDDDNNNDKLYRVA